MQKFHFVLNPKHSPKNPQQYIICLRRKYKVIKVDESLRILLIILGKRKTKQNKARNQIIDCIVSVITQNTSVQSSFV